MVQLLNVSSPWLRPQYAQWEEKQKDFRRARSVWERALDVNYNAVNLWLKYAEMEMRHRFVNHARNVWDRAVTLMPRVDQLWCVPAPCIWVDTGFRPMRCVNRFHADLLKASQHVWAGGWGNS